jgi:diacylglycerol kinase family enzyme
VHSTATVKIKASPAKTSKNDNHILFSSQGLALAPSTTSHYHLQFDNKRSCEHNLTGLLISNTRNSANFETFPDASINDGLFNVMELDANATGQIAHNISVLTRRHFYKPLSAGTSASIFVRPSVPHDLLIDGELFSGVTELTVTILPRRLTCICAS